MPLTTVRKALPYALCATLLFAAAAWALRPPLTTAKPYSKMSISTQVDKPAPQSSGSIDWTVRTEPISDLLPHEHAQGKPDGPHSLFPLSIPFIVPEDVWITGFETKVVNADQRTLHHATLYAGGLQDPVCPNSALTPDIYASSAYITEAKLPAPYALFLPKGTELLLSPMLHNPLPPLGPGGTYHDVSIQVHLHGEVATDSQTFKPVHLVRLRVDNRPCSAENPFQIFKVPAATSTYVISTDYDTATSTSASFVLPKSGNIISFGANFWPLKGGASVVGYLNDKKVATLVPVQSGSQPWEVDIPPMQKIVVFKKGDILRVEGTYLNPGSLPILDATAHLGVYIWYEQ